MTSISPFCGQLAMLLESSKVSELLLGAAQSAMRSGRKASGRVGKPGSENEKRERDVLCQPQGWPCTTASGGMLDIEDKQAAVVLNLGS